MLAYSTKKKLAELAQHDPYMAETIRAALEVYISEELGGQTVVLSNQPLALQLAYEAAATLHEELK